MGGLLIIVCGLVLGVAFAALVYLNLSKKGGDVLQITSQIEEVLTEKRGLTARAKEILSAMVRVDALVEKVQELLKIADSLKAERGRITITQAELETVETRLRELEEIERELEASAIESKEELKILQKKEKDLTNKNETLKAQLSASMEQLDSVLSQIQMSAEMQAQIDSMKSEMVQTQERIDILLLQIEQGNEQYFTLKQRYDALDIEYAQLYEKYAESEAMLGNAVEK